MAGRAGRDNRPDNASVYALAIDPSTPATLYAGTSASGRRGRLQEHRRRGELERRQHRPDWPHCRQGPGHRSSPLPRSTPGRTRRRRLQEHRRRGELERHQRGPDQHQMSMPWPSILRTPATLYAGTAGGVFKSSDGGESWAAANTGLTNLSVQALAINPTTPATLYAGTGGGVFRSTDSGGTWAAFNMGLPSLNVSALALDPTGTTLYAGLEGGGVWQLTAPTTGTHHRAPPRERSRLGRQRRLLHDERRGRQHRPRGRILHAEVPRPRPGRLERPRANLQPRSRQVHDVRRRPRLRLQRDLQLRRHPHHLEHVDPRHRLRHFHSRLWRHLRPDDSGRRLSPT